MSLPSFSSSSTHPLLEALDRKDRCTAGHAKRVSYYATKIASALPSPLSDEELECLRLGAILHDVGKIEIDDEILKKPSALNEQERRIMSAHPELGRGLLSSMDLRVVEGMLFHHERWDGTGYPMGLQEEQIPLLARVIAVADAYDAMVSTRPYRRGIAPQLAQREILRGAGNQFDPMVVSAFAAAFGVLR